MTKQSADRTAVRFLDSLIRYQDDSIVSREIVSKPTGTITVFAFDEGQGLSEHKAPYDGFVYVINGEATIRVSGVDHHLKAGETIFMPANEPHAVKAIKRFKMMLVMIRS